MARRRRGGRVTESKKRRQRNAGGESASPSGSTSSGSGRPAASGRYTPPAADYRLRPGWHRVAGWVGVAVGVLIVVLNDTMWIYPDVTVLPFGHNELYLVFGLAVALASTWFLGLFDRGTTIYD